MLVLMKIPLVCKIRTNDIRYQEFPKDIWKNSNYLKCLFNEGFENNKKLLRVFVIVVGRPVSWMMLTPALTPRWTADGPNNPGLRLYKFNKNTGQVRKCYK